MWGGGRRLRRCGLLRGNCWLGNKLDDMEMVVVGNRANLGTTTESKRATPDCVSGVKDAACVVSV